MNSTILNMSYFISVANNSPAMATRPEKYLNVTKYVSWEDFVIRNAHTVAFEQAFIQDYCNKARSVRVPAQFVQDDAEEDPDSYIVSFVLPNVETMSKKVATFVANLDIVECCFEPRRLIDPKTKKPCPDVVGWKGIITGNGALRGHTGTHLMKVRRPLFDKRPIASAKVWSTQIDYTGIYLKLKESDKTSKKQMKALDMLHPTNAMQAAKFDTREDENLRDVMEPGPQDSISIGVHMYEDDEIEHPGDVFPPFVPRVLDFTRQKGILLGHDILGMANMDFLGNLSDVEINAHLAACTPTQRLALLQALRNVCCGILVIIGAAGTGKTTVSIVIMLLLLAQEKKGLVASSTNAATNNICRRADLVNRNEQYLFVRLHPEHLEISAVRRYDAVSNPIVGVEPGNGDEKYYGEGSLAMRILQMAGILPTVNNTLVNEIRQHHVQLRSILTTPRSMRTDDQKDELGKCIRYAARHCRHIVARCDILFSTTVTSTSMWARWFVNGVDWTTLDEAGSISLPAALIVWKADIPCILIGDNAQLPNVVLSTQVKFTNTKPVNNFDAHLVKSALEMLIQNQWPYWMVPEQLRMELGLWDLPNILFYKGAVSVGPNVGVSLQAKMSEHFFKTALSQRTLNISRPSPHQLAAITSVKPVFLDVKNSHCFKEARGSTLR